MLYDTDNFKGTNNLIFIDGNCILCNRLSRFIISHDKKKIFKFAELDGKTFSNLSLTKSTDSIVLFSNKKTFIKSEAVFKIAQLLGGKFKLLLMFKILPKFITDFIYDKIAASRYKIFGRSDKCLVKSMFTDRFLD